MKISRFGSSFLAMGMAACALAPGRSGEGTPIACRLEALSPTERARHGALMRELESAVVETRETDDGFQLRLAHERMGLGELAEWIDLERRCCPFLRFEIEISPDDGPMVLRLGGRAGVKALLRSEFQHR